MTLRVLDQATDPGGTSPNEDEVGHADGAAWVIDGATGLSECGLLPGPSDAAWLALAYSRFLAERSGAETETRRMFAEASEEVARLFESERLRPPGPRYELPSAGVVYARARGGQVEFARLGDCRAILRIRQDGGREAVVTSGRSALHRLDAKVTHRLADLLGSGAAQSYSEARRAVQDALRANRSLMNVAGGYWVLGLDPAAARHMEVQAVELGGAAAEGLLVSDGLYRLVDTFGAYETDAALLDTALANGIQALLDEVRALERADPECRTHPRLKPSDDATGLLFSAAPD
jgi:hypothetical protein